MSKQGDILCKACKWLENHGFKDVCIIAICEKSEDSLMLKPIEPSNPKAICFEANRLIHSVMMDIDINDAILSKTIYRDK